MKIEYRSRKRSQARRNRKNQNVSISSDSVYDSVAYDPVKTRLSESEAEAQGLEWNIVIGLFFRFCLRLRQCSFHLIVSDGVISKISVLLLTPSV